MSSPADHDACRPTRAGTLPTRSGTFLDDLLVREQQHRWNARQDMSRALVLLYEACTPMQMTTLLRGFLIVFGSDSGGVYYVGGDLVAQSRNGEIRGYCIHPYAEDDSVAGLIEQMLAVKLLLETAEPRFHRLANETPVLPEDAERMRWEIRTHARHAQHLNTLKGAPNLAWRIALATYKNTPYTKEQPA